MRKCCLLVLSFLLFIPSFSMAELAKNKKPRPDWAFVKPSPSPENRKTFDYYIGVGYGKTLEEATNKAKADAVKQAILQIGVQISSNDLYKAEQDAEFLRVLTQQFEIPIKYLYEYFEPMGDMYKMQILCQAAINANITPRFEVYVETFEKVNSWRATMRQDSIKNNARALVASTFIPGMGQMLKKQGGSGAAFLLSELALFGGGTACYFLGQDQSKKMKAVGTSYDDYKAAKDKKHTYDIVMYSCFGVGAAVHIANMVHAWCVKDKSDKKKSTSMNFIPAIIPINELSQPSYAYGAGVQIKF